MSNNYNYKNNKKFKYNGHYRGDYYDNLAGGPHTGPHSGPHPGPSNGGISKPKFKRKYNNYDRYDPTKKPKYNANSSYGGGSHYHSDPSRRGPPYGNSGPGGPSSAGQYSGQNSRSGSESVHSSGPPSRAPGPAGSGSNSSANASVRINPYDDRRNNARIENSRRNSYEDYNYKKPKPAFELNSLKLRSISPDFVKDTPKPGPKSFSGSLEPSLPKPIDEADERESQTERPQAEKPAEKPEESEKPKELENPVLEKPEESENAGLEESEKSEKPEADKSEKSEEPESKEPESKEPEESEKREEAEKETTDKDAEKPDVAKASEPIDKEKPSSAGSQETTSTLTDIPSEKDYDAKLGTILEAPVDQSENELYTDGSDSEGASDAETVASESAPSTKLSKRLIKELNPEKAKRPYILKRDASGSSLLQRACKKGNFDEVKAFIERGADANESDFCGFTCLHEAALNGDAEIVRYLIDHGADVNKQALPDGDLETPLIDAADNKHLEIVKILLDHGADPRIYNSDGFTALTKIHNLHQDESGYDEIISLLEEANSKFIDHSEKHKLDTQKSPSPNTIIEDPNDNYFSDLLKKKNHSAQIYKYAAEGIKDLAVQYIVEGGRLDYKPDILILAARNGHFELVDIMLGLVEDYDINLENNCGLTALLASVGRGHYSVVNFLLSKGANPFARRKQDNLNALEISQGSANFDMKEIELIESYMKKNPNYSILSKSVKPGSNLNRSISESIVETEEKKEKKERPELKRKSASEVEEKKKKPRLENDLKKMKSKEEKSKEEKSREDPEESGIKPQVSNLFKDEIAKSREQSASPPPADLYKSVSPPQPAEPIPLTKEQIELREKSEKEMKLYQEKAEAKRRQRRDMFLKAEREKERKRKEEEIKKQEEERQMELQKKQEAESTLKKIEEETKRIEAEKATLTHNLTLNSYPIGLRFVKFGQTLSKTDILKYCPVYLFEFNDKQYVIDLQIAMITGFHVDRINQGLTGDERIETSFQDKSKLWNLFAPLIGSRDNSIIPSVELLIEGHDKFQFLEVSFIAFDKVTSLVQSQAPLTHQTVWETNCFTKVDFKQLNLFNPSSQALEPKPDTIEVESLQRFVPPSFKHRPDLLRAIHEAKTPLW